MLLTEYLSELTKTIDEYSKTGLIISSELNLDARTEKIGLIKAATTFSDDSKLFVTEYLDLRYKTDKLSYSFHYQDNNGSLIFRYDNAVHRPIQSFRNHKHTGDSIIQSAVPELRSVLEEIIGGLLKKD